MNLFFKKIDAQSLIDCWIWLGKPNKNGYGRFANKLSHRISYTYFIGEIPEGQIIRHTCHNRLCVNPHHLIPGTKKDNYKDMVEAGRARWQKLATDKYCKRGHKRTKKNTYVRTDGRKECLKCKKLLRIMRSSDIDSFYVLEKTSAHKVLRIQKVWRDYSKTSL